MCPATPNGCRDTKHPTLRIKLGEAFQWGSGGWEAKPADQKVLLRCFWGVCSVSRLIFKISVADLVACNLILFMSAVARRPVTPRLWSVFSKPCWECLHCALLVYFPKSSLNDLSQGRVWAKAGNCTTDCKSPDILSLSFSAVSQIRLTLHPDVYYTTHTLVGCRAAAPSRSWDP